MYYDNEEFEEKIEGYKIPRQKKLPPADGPFVGPPKTEANKNLRPSGYQSDKTDKFFSKHDHKKKHKGSKNSNDGFNANMEPLGDREFDQARVTKVDPLALGDTLTYKEARGHGQSGLNLFLAQFEGDLPEELTEKMENFECKLCTVNFLQGEKFNAKTAQSHYAGKSHMKKFKLELKDWNEKDPEKNKMPTIKENEQKPQIELDDQDQNYCHVCELQLTSAIVAQSHYTGKPHQKKMSKRIAEGTYHVGKQALITGHKRPADGKVPVPTEGFPDSIKKPKMDDQPIFADAESRQGSGNRFFCMGCKINFKTSGEFSEHIQSQAHKERAKNPMAMKMEGTSYSTTPSNDSVDDMLKKLRENPKSAFDCSLCQVQCSSQATLSTHLAGKQHKKKFEMSQKGAGSASGFRCEICNIETSDQGGLDMHLAGKNHRKKAAKAN